MSTKKINCIIIDDEPLARELLSDYIQRLENLSLVRSFEDAIPAIEFLRKHTVDLIFLDIQMPVLDGIDFLKGLAKPPKVIFTTAHRQYAVEGFELNAVDYLVKPIPFYRFVQAVGKVGNVEHNEEHKPGIAFFKVDKKRIRVQIEDILIIESLKDYIRVILKDQSFVTYYTLSGVLELLPESHFVQVHKSFIINYHCIDAIEGNLIRIHNKTIPMGRSFKENALKKIYSTGEKIWK